MIDYKSAIAAQIAQQFNELDQQTIQRMLEYPPNPEMGDVSLPCFQLSKLMRKAPALIAEQMKQQLEPQPYLDKIEVASGYVNFFFNREEFAEQLIRVILTERSRYGSLTIGNGKTIVIDYSSPNIAKPFHVGHLRSTMIGHALYNIFKFSGYECVGINHLGDWGTQFGKLIVAYHLWGKEAEVVAGGIAELLRLYVKFHEEAEQKPELDEEARAWFVKLENGDKQAEALWTWFKEISIKEFNRIYELLGIEFDSHAGESFYNDKMGPVVQDLLAKKLLEEDEGAMLVRLDEFNMPPALILKKDGGTLYHTRDITAAIYRKNTYGFDKVIYVTGGTQNLHFQQWFKVIELMGFPWAQDLIHVPFGQVSLEGAKLSTRKGNVIMLEELLQQAIQKTLEIIESKNPNLEDKEEIARQVGVGAIVFNDLSSNRIKDTVFSWEEVLNFDGETGPYVQYTHARACSVLRKAGVNTKDDHDQEQILNAVSVDPTLLNDKATVGTLKQLYLFPERVQQAMEKLEPSIISRYLVDLAQSFNRFYHECPILVEDVALRNARLALVRCVQITMQNGLRLIGLETPEKI